MLNFDNLLKLRPSFCSFFIRLLGADFMDPLKLSVATAFITAAAMLISSVINAIVAYGTAKRASVTEFIKLRAKIFADVMDNDVFVWRNGFSDESMKLLISAVHQATLFSSEETVLKLLAFLESVKKDMDSDELQHYRECRIAAVHAMRYDLMNYAAPKAKSNRLQRLWRNVKAKQGTK